MSAPTTPSTDDTPAAVDTLHIRVEPDNAFDERVLGALDAATDDERELQSGQTLSLPDTEALARVLSPTAIDLIRTIRAEEPSSIRETAAAVDRDVKEVHRNLTELAEFSVIQFVEEGQAKRPTVWYDEIEVHIAVDKTDGGSAPASAAV
jgi:predicted transcriptional regulator